VHQAGTPDQSSHDFPRQLTSFIGREIELAELKRLLGERRLITLTGAGGSGKTRLALELCASLATQYIGGVFIVELAPLSKAELVVETIRRVLGVEGNPNQPPLETLAVFLRNRRSLLVLDNCEHLLDECARIASMLLGACPDLQILATSREPLGITGECLFRVPLLSLPGPGFLSDPERLSKFESVQLFVDRARLTDPVFTITQSNAEAVAQVCIHLDGIPLAIELAAASLRVLTISQLASRLDERFRLLTSGNRIALPRQQTLKALLDWSHALLVPAEQIVFRRLAVFPGDWALDAAEYTCGGIDTEEEPAPGVAPEDVLSTLFHLVDKSLVQLDAVHGRHHMLETIRLYALSRLEEEGERDSVAERHLDWYLRFAEEGFEQEGTKGQQAWFLSLEIERDNIRVALNWAVASHRSEEAARLALAVRPFWIARAYHREALHWLEQILALDAVAPIGARLKVRLLNALGFVAQEVKSFDLSTRYYTEALHLLQELGDTSGAVASLLSLGWNCFVAADLDAAERYAEEGLALARREGDLNSVGVALNLLSSTRVADGKLDGVIPAVEEALDIWRQLGNLHEVANTLSIYAQAERILGNLEHACALLLEGLRLHVSLGTYAGLISPIVSMFHFALHACKPPGKHIYLARLSGVFAGLEEKIGGVRSPWVHREIFPLYEQISTELGEEGFAREMAAGQELSIQGIVTLAEEIVHSVLAFSSTVSSAASLSPTSPRPALYPAGLTHREVEVLKLVAAGLTNQQAASLLSVTPRTINAHLTSIYNKIGVTSRTGAVRFAMDHDLA
jgi:predicted ATPase/DNA-binding CsgD family transcriptional regulator